MYAHDDVVYKLTFNVTSSHFIGAKLLDLKNTATTAGTLVNVVPHSNPSSSPSPEASSSPTPMPMPSNETTPSYSPGEFVVFPLVIFSSR